MKENIRILIADDHPFFTEGVINALRPNPQYSIVSSPYDGNLVIASIQEKQPAIILLDINLPGRDGLSLAKEIRNIWPPLRIILLTMYMPEDIQLATDAPFFDGYVLKNSGTEVLLSAITAVKEGERFLDPNIKPGNHHSQDNFTKQLKLSSREKEILQLLIAGHNNRQIAALLFLSELTIKTHRKNLMSKLGAHNLADLLNKGK